MKLIDLLVQELPKRGGWPHGAEYARVSGFGVEKILVEFLFPEGYNKLIYSIGIIACHLIDAGVDCQMIRRDSYESALAASQKTVWSGEGLPPSGVECEARLRCNDGEWFLFRCVGVDCGVAFGWARKEVATLGKGSYEFRPLRTEKERKRDEAAEAIDFYMPEFITDTPNEFYHAKKIYDAIAAGKIPGVKLED